MNLPSAGDVVGDRFRLESEIGVGGFATVMLATDLTSNERVAVKLLRPDVGGAARDIAARFEREVELLASLRHPSIVEILGHGIHDGVRFAVFELLDGAELADVLLERGTLRPDEVRAVLLQLLEALRVAHDAGVLHRDIKPENIIVTRQSPIAVKLIDFGIARPLEAVGPQITATGDTIGTIRYMSPEQLKADPLSPASDLYSLGMVGVEMLLGRDGLHGGALHEQFERLRTGHVFSVPALEKLDPPLQRVLTKMTASKPHERFQSAGEVLAALGDEPRPGRLGILVVLAVVLVAVAVMAFLGLRPEESTPVPTVNKARQSKGLVRGADPLTPEPISQPPEPEVVDPTCEAIPLGRLAGIDASHQVLVHGAEGLRADDVRGVVVVFPDNSGVRPEAQLEAFRLDGTTFPHALLLVPETKVSDRGSSWDAPNTRQIALRVSLLLDGWCVPRDTPLYLLAEGNGAKGIDRWLCVDLPDVRQPEAVVTSAHRYTREEPLPCKGTRPRVLNLVQLNNTVEPVKGGKSPCHDEFTFVSANEQERWWLARHECQGRPRRVSRPHGVCKHYRCGYSRCDVEGGRDWFPRTREPDDPSIPCVGDPGEFPYHDVVREFFFAASDVD